MCNIHSTKYKIIKFHNSKTDDTSIYCYNYIEYISLFQINFRYYYEGNHTKIWSFYNMKRFMYNMYNILYFCNSKLYFSNLICQIENIFHFYNKIYLTLAALVSLGSTQSGFFTSFRWWWWGSFHFKFSGSNLFVSNLLHTDTSCIFYNIGRISIDVFVKIIGTVVLLDPVGNIVLFVTWEEGGWISKTENFVRSDVWL